MKHPPPSKADRFARVPGRPSILVGAFLGCAAGSFSVPAIGADGDSSPDSAEVHSITVSIDSIVERHGDIRVALYSTAEGFDADEPLATVREPATGSAVTVSFEGVPNGDYAVMLYHDVNDNETLDRNLLGIPNEPWAGSSNGSVFGPPGWDDVRFELDGVDLTLNLSL